MADTSRDLRERCSAALEAGLSWRAVWFLIVDHDRYEKLLQRCAFLAVRRSRLPSDWQKDIASGARTRLAERLAKDVYLEVDPARVDQEYLLRLAHVTRNVCRQAVKKAERTGHRQAERVEQIPAPSAEADDRPGQRTLEDFCMDFETAFPQLDDQQQRVIVLRFFEFSTIQAIADELDVTHRKAELAVDGALQRLRWIMSPPSDRD